MIFKPLETVKGFGRFSIYHTGNKKHKML